MKVMLTFKTPDVIHEACEDLTEEEEEEVEEICKRWIKYEEYISVVVDTEAKTCTVLDQ